MASRMMHLAIANKLLTYNIINNPERFEIGQILPDAITHDLATHADSHYKVTVCEGKKKMIDFTEFRANFQNEILSDDLYLGYYLHLIQDALYRKFLYHDLGYNVTCPRDVEILHNDYRLLNTYLVTKYNLVFDYEIPVEFESEKINTVYSFALDNYIEEMKSDFLPYSNGETSIITEDMVDNYITECVELCGNELRLIKEGKTCMNPMDYAWELPPRRPKI